MAFSGLGSANGCGTFKIPLSGERSEMVLTSLNTLLASCALEVPAARLARTDASQQQEEKRGWGGGKQWGWFFLCGVYCPVLHPKELQEASLVPLLRLCSHSSLVV